MNPKNELVISIKELRMRYGDNYVLRGIDLEKQLRFGIQRPSLRERLKPSLLDSFSLFS
jgi:hypothetical protein